MAGLFSIFNIGVRGLSAQQTALNVTSHNIANANTEGYSRQRAVLETTAPYGGNGMNSPGGAGQLGTGVQVSQIQRLRDTFLDYQIRSETSSQGTAQATEKYVSQIEGVFNEPSDSGISSLMTKFFSSWKDLAAQPANSTTRTIAVQNANTVAGALNTAYSKMQDIKNNANIDVSSDVFDINNMLNDIDKLNQQIKDIKIEGNEPNDLMDKRDLLLDKLSSKLGITVSDKDFDGQDVSPTIAAGSGPSDTSIIKSQNNQDVKRLSYISSVDPVPGQTDVYKVSYYKMGNTASDATMSSFNVKLDAGKEQSEINQLTENRVLWATNDGTAVTTDSSGKDVAMDSTSTYNFSDVKFLQSTKGEISGYVAVQQSIDDYTDQLNKLAKALALTVNAVESGVTNVTDNNTVSSSPTAVTPPNTMDTDYMPFFVNSAVANKNYASDSSLSAAGLKAVLDAESGITAGNISINKAILKDGGEMQIKTQSEDNSVPYETGQSTDGARAGAVSNLQLNIINISAIGSTINTRADLFNVSLGGNNLSGTTVSDSSQGMTMDNYYRDMINRIATEENTAKSSMVSQQQSLDSYTQNKESYSGVSMDEEMTNMIQFQHAYQANAKIISTIDQLLDVVINGLKK